MKLKILLKEKFEKQTGDYNEVGLFFRCPQELDSVRGNLGEEDESPAHVTFLYIGKLDKKNENKFLNIVEQEFSKIKQPVIFELEQNIEYFKNDLWAAHQRVVVPKIMHQIRKDLKNKLIENGINVEDSYDEYKPHMTRAYFEPNKTEDLKPIKYKWNVDNIEVWGVSQIRRIEFMKRKKIIIKENVEVQEYITYITELIDSVLNDFDSQQSQIFLQKLIKHLQSKLADDDGYERLKMAYNRIKGPLNYVSTYDLAKAANLSASDFRGIVDDLIAIGKVSLSGENAAVMGMSKRDYLIFYKRRIFTLIKIK